MMLPTIILHRDDPPTPTSSAELLKEEKVSYFGVIKKLVKNYTYMAMWLYISVHLGFYSLLSAVTE